MFREFVAGKQRAEDEADSQKTIAWFGAMLQRQPKLPELKKFLSKKYREKPQTKKQQHATLHLLAAQYGWKVRKYRKPKPKIDGQ